MFVKLVCMWFKLRSWYITCNDPIKLQLIDFMMYTAHFGLKQIGWWVPKYVKPNDEEFPPLPSIGQLKRSVEAERKNG